MTENRPTLQDIAHRTGLSVATVSRALHRDDSPNVSGETRLRVRTLAREMGYQPNLLSRSLATGKTQTVSYWTYDAFAPYYAMVAREICQQAAQRGYYLHIHNTFHPVAELDPAAKDDSEAAKSFVGDGPALALSFDGVIACDVAYEDNHFAARLHQARVPMVGIGINYPPDCDFVGIDLTLGAEKAMTHLLESGCRRIVHVCQPNARENKDRRAMVYAQRMNEAGLPVEWLFCQHNRAAARAAIAAFIHENPGPVDAFFCANDEVAVGCYRGLTDAGITIPDTVFLVGCDGIVETEYQYCPITTIAAPVAAMCSLAWDFLQARLREPDRPLQQVLLPPELIVRRSSTGNL